MDEEMMEVMRAYEANSKQKVPEHTQRMLDGYLKHGEPPGDFLEAVLCNNLTQAYAKADDINIANMYAIVKYVYNEFPINAWGSVEKIDYWLKFIRENK